VCVCVYAQELERGRVCVCVQRDGGSGRKRVGGRESVFMCVHAQERETEKKESMYERDSMNMVGRYGVATNRRLLKITGLFCRISSVYRVLLQKRPIILRSLLIEATP